MKLRNPHGLLLGVLLALAGSLAACTLESSPDPTPTPTEIARAELPTPTPRTMWFEVELEPDAREPATLVETADAIFIGTVVGAGDGFYRGPLREFVTTWTAFEVEVEEVLLGDVAGQATVAQMGGLHPEEPFRLVVLLDTPESMEELAPLEIGTTYLFVTEAGDPTVPGEQGIYFAEPAVGHIPIEDEDQRRELVEEFTEAIESAGSGS